MICLAFSHDTIILIRQTIVQCTHVKFIIQRKHACLLLLIIFSLFLRKSDSVYIATDKTKSLSNLFKSIVIVYVHVYVNSFKIFSSALHICTSMSSAYFVH